MKFGFRVVDKDTGDQFFEGCYVNVNGDLYLENMMDGRLDPPSGQKDLAVQYSTGIFDVDGKEIFEGDWVAWESESKLFLHQAKIVFSPTVSAFVIDVNGRNLFDSKYGDYQHLHRERKYTIINK